MVRDLFAVNLIVLAFSVFVFARADFLERSLFCRHVGNLLLVILNFGLVNGSSGWRFGRKVFFRWLE